jgi:hypothetical protein
MIIELSNKAFSAIVIESGSLSSEHGPQVKFLEPQYVPLYSANKYKQVVQAFFDY